ncbi:MAG: hypothetical protein ACM34M_10780 [Ignavibacteria bacterium]
MNRNDFNDCVQLRFFPREKCVFINELTGNDEQSIRGTRSLDAIKLVNRLLTDSINSAEIIGNASKLTIFDRDRILVAVYLNTYGTKIGTTLTCTSCKKAFDIDFSLDEINDKLNSKQKIEHLEKCSDSVFNLENGAKFRLPTGEDELAVLVNSASEIEKELLKRCLVESNRKDDLDCVEDILQNLAPLINFNFDVCCPECSAAQNLRFDIQTYLLSSLLQEQKQLAYEVHKLAYAYKWGLNEILELPRSIRRAYVSFMD